MKYVVESVNQLQGVVRVPGDKSISHRSIILGAIADGVTHIKGFLEGEDAIATMNAFRALGVHIEGPDHGKVQVNGVGLEGLKPPTHSLDCGNSGTSMRLMTGLLAGAGIDAVLVGDESLSKRPMKRVTDPLRLMGADIEATATGTPPLKVKKTAVRLHAIDYTLPMASAQVKSSVLLAGLFAEGVTSVTEPAPTRDHSERMLKGFGVSVDVQGATIRLEGGQRLTGCDIDVPADISSAAFFMVAAAIAESADVTLVHVGMNPTRTGVLDILRLMGANFEVTNATEVGGEPVADIRIRSGPLRGICIPDALVPLAIDEFPVLFVAAANAHGTTLLTGAHELRVKESDRIAVMADGLKACGIDAQAMPDGMLIHGRGEISGARYAGAEVASHGDHRIAMSFTVAALRASSSMTVLDCKNVATSFPGFVELARQLGFSIEVQN